MKAEAGEDSEDARLVGMRRVWPTRTDSEREPRRSQEGEMDA